MDEIKKRLQSDNIFVQRQAASKLLRILTEQLKTENVKTSAKQSKELLLVWELCNSEIAATYCCKILLELVFAKKLDPTLVSNGFLNILPSTKHWKAVVSSICSLYIHFSTKKDDEINLITTYNSEKLMHHPMVRILQICPQFWQILMENVKKLVDVHNGKFPSCASPLISYIYGLPHQSSHITAFQKSFVKFYLKSPWFLNSSLLHYILWLKHGTFEEVLESWQILQDIVLEVSELTDESKSIKYILYVWAMDFCKYLSVQQLDGVPFFLLIYEKLHKSFENENLDLILASLHNLLITCPEYMDSILFVMKNITSRDFACSSPVAGLWMFSLLQIISSASSFESEKNQCNKAKFVMSKLEISIANRKSNLKDALQIESFQFDMILARTKVDLVINLCQEKNFMCLEQKIDGLLSVLDKAKRCSNFLIHVLGSITLHHINEIKIVEKCLDCIQKCLTINADQATGVLPFSLYILNKAAVPEVKFIILQKLSMLSNFKFAIGSLIRIVESIFLNEEMRHIMIGIMYSIWLKNDRCFAHLLKMISFTKKKALQDNKKLNKWKLARAITIRSICVNSPNRHGEEMLPFISSVLNNKESEPSSNALALQSLYALCESKCIDLENTLDEFKEVFQNAHDFVVVKEICKLLTLASEIKIESSADEKFRNEIVSRLWNYTTKNFKENVRGAAFHSLALFYKSDFRIHHFPASCLEGITQETLKSMNDENCMPGIIFTNLLLSLEELQLIEDYGVLLSSLVREEVKSLPSLAYFPKARHLQKKKADSVLSVLPALTEELLHSQNLGLKDSVAFSCLLCYQPISNDSSDDGKLAKAARDAQHVLSEVISNLSLDVSNWKKCVCIPDAWTTFMDRLFSILIDGRNAELRLQISRKKLNGTEEEIALKFKETPLWVRDRIVDILKESSKGRSSCQGNAVLALAALLAISSNHFKVLSEKDKAEMKNIQERMPQSYWEVVVVETILTVVNPKHKTSETVFSWLKNTSSMSGNLLTGVSVVALTMIMPYIRNCSEKVPYFIKLIVNPLTSEDPDASTIFYHGFALGLFIPKIYQYGDIELSDLRLIHRLRKMCFLEDIKGIGTFSGLTRAVCHLCVQYNQKAIDFVKSVHGQLMSTLKNESSASMEFEGLAICTSTVTSFALTSQHISMASAEHLLVMLDERRQRNSSCNGTATALGILIRCFIRVKHVKAEELKNTLLKLWLPVLANKESSLLSKMAALNGLASLFGLGFSYHQPTKMTQDPEIGLNEFFSLLIQHVRSSKDLNLRSSSLCTLAQFYQMDSDKFGTTDPSSYSYLPDSSILKNIVQVLKNFKDIKGYHTHQCLDAIGQQFTRHLPPLDWNGLLFPIINENNDLLMPCLKICFNQYKASLSSRNTLNGYLSPSMFLTLKIEVQTFIIENLPKISTFMQLNSIKGFLNNILLPLLSNLAKHCLHEIILKMLIKMIDAPEPPQGYLISIHEFIPALYKIVLSNTSHFMDEKYLQSMCQIMSMLPASSLDELLHPDEEYLDFSFMIRLQMIGYKFLPLSSISVFLEYSHKIDQRIILRCIFSNFKKITDTLNAEAKINWLLDLMSKIHHRYRDPFVSQVSMQALVLMFIAAVVAWGDDQFHALVVERENVLGAFIEIFPVSLFSLLELPVWNNMSLKVLDWLMFLMECKNLDNVKLKEAVVLSICRFKHLKQFSSSTTWLKAVDQVLSVNLFTKH